MADDQSPTSAEKPGPIAKQNEKEDVVMATVKDTANLSDDTTLVNRRQDASLTPKKEPEKENNGYLSAILANNPAKRKRATEDVGDGRCPVAPMDVDSDATTSELASLTATTPVPAVGTFITQNQLPALKPGATDYRIQTRTGQTVKARTPLPTSRPIRPASIAQDAAGQVPGTRSLAIRAPGTASLAFHAHGHQVPGVQTPGVQTPGVQTPGVQLPAPTGAVNDGAANNGPDVQGPAAAPGQQGIPEREANVAFGRMVAEPTLRLVNSGDYGLLQALSNMFTNLDQYHGVLNHHDSIAAHLGVKLMTPDVQPGVIGLLKGEIQYTCEHAPCGPGHCVPPTWFEIIHFARDHPDRFILRQAQNGDLCSTFIIKDWKCTISEADYRLIRSGAMHRLLCPFEDEISEITAVSVVQDRLNHVKWQLQTSINKILTLQRALLTREASAQHRLWEIGAPASRPSPQQRSDILNQIYAEENRRLAAMAQAARPGGDAPAASAPAGDA